jgi:hypothetical protein
MVLTVSFVLSPVTGLFCHRHPADNSAELDSSVGASGPHDFAVHLKRRSSCSAVSVHRIPPRVRDDRASAPLWDGTVSDILLIWVKREQEYFCKGGWTGISLICPSGTISGWITGMPCSLNWKARRQDLPSCRSVEQCLLCEPKLTLFRDARTSGF